jgi:hypothetical protein
MRCKVSLEYAVIRHLSNPRFPRICAILLAGLWNEILDGEHVHPIRCLRVFLAFAPSKWKDKFAFCGSQFFSCLIEMCVWWFYYDLIEKHHAPGSTMTRWCLQVSLIVSWCTTHLQTLVFVLLPGSQLQCFLQDGYKEGVAVDLLSTTQYSRSTLTD